MGKNKGKNMQTELAFKEQISTLLDNPILTSLIRDKRYEVDKNTIIELEGSFNFSLKFENDRLVLNVLNIQPKVTFKKILTFNGRINSISIGKNDILITIENLPDVRIGLI